MRQIYVNLDSERPHATLNDPEFKQGNFNREFYAMLYDDGKMRTLDDADKPTIIFDYYDKNRNFVEEVVVKDGETSDYNITVSSNVIHIPARKEIADFAGHIVMSILLDELYTYELQYDVLPTKNYTYESKITNLPTYESYAKKDLSNVVGFSDIAEGSILVKQGGVFAKSALKETADKIISSKTIQVPPSTLEIGTNTALHENGGFLEYHTRSLNKDYILLDYENNPETGTSKPIYWKRDTKVLQLELEAVATTAMTLVSTTLTAPLSDRQVQAFYLKLVDSVSNLCVKVTVNNQDVAYYPSQLAWDAVTMQDKQENPGYSKEAGLQRFLLKPFFSELKEYTVTLTFKADAPIRVLGSGTIPYLAIDYNPITRKEIALMEDLSIQQNSRFTDLVDTPDGYAGSAGYVVIVNQASNALQFVKPVDFFNAIVEQAGAIISGGRADG